MIAVSIRYENGVSPTRRIEGCFLRTEYGTDTPSLTPREGLTFTAHYSNRWPTAEAVQFARQSIVVDPEFWVGHLQLAQALEQLGENEQALDALTSAGRFSGGNSKVLALRGYIFAKLGRLSEARDVLRTLVAVARERYVPPYAMALVHDGLAEPDDSLEWLDRSFDAHDVHLVFLPIDPKWDSFRADPRFAAILKRSGLPMPVMPVQPIARTTHSPGMV